MALVHSMPCRAGRAGAAAVCRLFEAAAAAHAAALGVGIEALRREGKAWMLVRFGLRANRWPEPGEPLEVRTWPSRRTAGARAWREFLLLDAGGRTLAEAASVWLIVDLERRRPVRLPEFLHELDFPPLETGVEFLDPPQPAREPDATLIRRVEPAHLDANEHVNNVTYIEWGEEAAAGPRAARLQADYLGEARLGEQLAYLTWRDVDGRAFLQLARVAAKTCVCLQWW